MNSSEKSRLIIFLTVCLVAAIITGVDYSDIAHFINKNYEYILVGFVIVCVIGIIFAPIMPYLKRK
jgi:H+/gluconate symporter-like permease